MSITRKLSIAAIFIGATTFGYAQSTNDSTAVSTQAEEQNQMVVQSADPTIDSLKEQLQANPNDTDALVKLATAYQDNQDWTNALKMWNKITTILPDWAPGYYGQGYVYQSLKDDANAKLAFEKYIAFTKPAEVESSKQNLAYAHLFVAYQMKDSDKRSAKQHIAKALEYDPNNQDAVKLNEYLSK